MRHMVPTKQRFSAPTVVHTTSKSYPSSILLYIYRSNQAINQESSYYQNKIYVAYHPEIIIAADVKWADLSFFWTSVRHGYSVVSSNLHAFGK